MISSRLETIVEIIGETKSVVDIGADHGYVLLELLKRNKCFDLCGVENKIGPLNILKENTKAYSHNIKVILSDGLQNVNEIYETIVIAGMGFSTIKTIIERDLEKIKKSKYIVIDSHNHLELLRKFMNRNDFKIVDERMVYEKGIYYSIIKYENGNESLNELELTFGPIILKSKTNIFLQYLNYLKNDCNTLLEKDLSSERRKEISKKLDLVEKALAYCD